MIFPIDFQIFSASFASHLAIRCRHSCLLRNKNTHKEITLRLEMYVLCAKELQQQYQVLDVFNVYYRSNSNEFSPFVHQKNPI